MQIHEDNGTIRELEPWELEALEAAQEKHDAENGIVRQYSDAKARELLLGIVANMADLPAEHAVHMVAVYPAWKSGEHYSRGYRVRRNDKLYTVLQDHLAQDDWSPESAPSLFAEVLPGQQGSAEAEAGEPGEWVQPDSANPYMMGDRVTHGGKAWTSDVDNNVWEPGVYGWTEDAE